MIESFYIGGYWGARPESIEECVDRLQAFSQSLARVDPLLASWFEKGRSRESALQSEVNFRTEQLWDLLLSGRNRDDAGGRVIQNLGFSVDLWNGAESAVSLSVHCGAWSSTGGPSNSLFLELPEVGDLSAARLYQPATALLAIRAVVDAWAPSYVTWVNYPIVQAQHPKAGEIAVGWATYLADERIDRSGPLPTDVQTESMGDGVVIIVGDNPTAVPLDSIMAVRQALGPAILPDLY
jgi:hypothetical protein